MEAIRGPELICNGIQEMKNTGQMEQMGFQERETTEKSTQGWMGNTEPRTTTILILMEKKYILVWISYLALRMTEGTLETVQTSICQEEM